MSVKAIKCKFCDNKVMPKHLDYKNEICDKCFLKCYGKKFTIVLSLDIDVKHTSAEEMIEYFDSIANYTIDVQSYEMRFEIK